MKVTGSNGMSPSSGARPARGGGGQGGFAVPASGAGASAADVGRTAGLTGVASLGALLALQDVGGPLERRRRAMGRAGRILDVLDDLKVSLLDGGAGPAALERLMGAVREERAGTDDPGLEGVLDEIETRAAVEMAKLEQARRAARGRAMHEVD